jgi:acetyl-CoA carboxylase biotin carboxylase subunit
MLVANRGEIAVRIIRACHEMDIEAVLAHSEADRHSLAARLADHTVCIGPPPSEASYLNIPHVVAAALTTGCDALHPGYGFLSENAYLAEVCGHCGITFVGPPPSVIEAFRDKVAARKLMAEAGLPILPGSLDAAPSLEAARTAAAGVGFPVMLKAAAGGGGRGMRVADSDDDIIQGYAAAHAEALSSFANGDLYVERLVSPARHIEVQIAADAHGHVVHLGERECSLQRRHQKLLEETPSPRLSPSVRTGLFEAAVRAARTVDYQSVGTMEFLVDEDDGFYFIEMNTRLQVEHAVTEMVTGIDVVKLQIRLADGETLPFHQKQVISRGHAIECRVLSEDPNRDFAPDHQVVREYTPAGGPGVRIDTHIHPGYAPPPYYDSLLAKVVCWGVDRAEAIKRMERALKETKIVGPQTTVPYHLGVLADEEFRLGRTHTRWTLGESRRSDRPG